MSDILLTEEAMLASMGYRVGDRMIETATRVAKAQLARVFEWGEEPCPHGSDYKVDFTKRRCQKCWQALKDS